MTLPLPHAETPPPSADRKPTLGLYLILGALTAFAPISIDMYLPTLPTLARELHGTAGGAQATVAAFFIGLSLGQLVYGPWSDRLGRRGPLLFGIGLYILASVACAFATSIPLLIAARGLQALGGCAGVVVARAVVRDRFDHAETARVFSTLMLIMGLAPILAPLAGGSLMQAVGWRWIFGVLALFGALVGVAVLFALPESRGAAVAEKARGENPFKAYAALLRQRRLVAYVVTASLSSGAMFAYIATSPALVIETYRVPATAFGWVFGANAVGIIGASQLNRLFLRRFTPDQVLRVSTAWAAIAAALLLAVALSGRLGLFGILVPLFLTIAVGGLTGPNAGAGALAQDPLRAGSLSAFLGAMQFGVGALAAGIAGVLSDGTARPMAGVIAVCALAGVVATAVATRRTPTLAA